MVPTYETVTDPDLLLAHFGVRLPEGATPPDLAGAGPWSACIMRSEPAAALEVRLGLLGLLPHFATDVACGRQTTVCPVETMKSAPAFRESWWAGRRCVVPLRAMTAWSVTTGRPERWCVQGAGGLPLAVAGLWNTWADAAGEAVLSFTLLTLPATGHALFSRMVMPGHEPRLPAVLPAGAQALWLQGSLKEAERLLRPSPAEAFQAELQSPGVAVGQRAPDSWAAMPDMFALEWHAEAASLARPARTRRRRPASATDTPGPTTADLFWPAETLALAPGVPRPD